MLRGEAANGLRGSITRANANWLLDEELHRGQNVLGILHDAIFQEIVQQSP